MSELIYNQYDSSEMITEKILNFLEINKVKRKDLLTQYIRDIIQGERK